jgi:hypothetical protein
VVSSGWADLDRGLFSISVAAELAGLHPQTLRIYEREGLLDPARSAARRPEGPAAAPPRRQRGIAWAAPGQLTACLMSAVIVASSALVSFFSA